ncbi:immune inhibitor A domain-containing protein [Solirubrobacter phytolaccae]
MVLAVVALLVLVVAPGASAATWDDYKPIPGANYADPSLRPTVKQWKVAIVLADFPDRDFIVSQSESSTLWGTPTVEVHSVPRAEVPRFYADFLNRPQRLNHFQTMHRYWMENSYGRYGVELVPFGPYRMPHRAYQYFLRQYAAVADSCPTPALTPCNANFRADARAAWERDVGTQAAAAFDNVFYVAAGAAESDTWREFGEMRFTGPEAIPDRFGPHPRDALTANWARTRFAPWTSWASAASIWPTASGDTATAAETTGMGGYAHELSHNLGLDDNYNNPFARTVQRSASGNWDMMSRGSSNGPGGPHTRWLVPSTQGGSLGAQHAIHNKAALGFLDAGDVLHLSRELLATAGPAVVDVKAREVAPHGETVGVDVALDGDGGDQSAPCTFAANPLCDGGGYDRYTLEVVQQIGSDSFLPGHGVLIAKAKDRSSSCGSFRCSLWYVDANPRDIDQVDYVRPDGTAIKVNAGDDRQLDDAAFDAGVGSGTRAEYVDAANRLHFYVIDRRTDADGVLHHTVAVRSLDDTGARLRGVRVGAPTVHRDGDATTCTFPVTNTGDSADVLRLWATSARLRTVLVAPRAGETVLVPVDVEPGPGRVTLTAVSESDDTRSASASCGGANSKVQEFPSGSWTFGKVRTPISFELFRRSALREVPHAQVHGPGSHLSRLGRVGLWRRER